MNDFYEIENELKRLRPAQPSTELLARVERTMADDADVPRAQISRAPRRWRFFTDTPYRFGFGLAAAAALALIFARLEIQKQPQQSIAATVTHSPVPVAPSVQRPVQFLPTGTTRVVYHRRDEGLRFPESSDRPVRRIHSYVRDTLRWRNPATGASLAVSYPSEQVDLIPVSGQ